MSAPRSAILRGQDHHRVGGLELVGEGDAAIAISRGGARKTYSHTDPNEDCVAFAIGEGGQLVVAADGHHGHHGAEAAVRTILEEFADSWTAASPLTRDTGEWVSQGFEALMSANRSILEIAAQYQLPPAPTTFVLALVRPDEDLLLHLSVGDSHLFAVDSGAALDLGGRQPDWDFTPFLGYEQASLELLERYAKVGQRNLESLRALVLATDGLSEPGIGVEDPARSVFEAVSATEADTPSNRRAVDACRGVTEIAMHAQRRQKAGDNMGCSVLWLESESSEP